MKLFKISNNDIISDCRNFLCLSLPSELLVKRDIIFWLNSILLCRYAIIMSLTACVIFCNYSAAAASRRGRRDLAAHGSVRTSVCMYVCMYVYNNFAKLRLDPCCPNTLPNEKKIYNIKYKNFCQVHHITPLQQIVDTSYVNCF